MKTNAQLWQEFIDADEAIYADGHGKDALISKVDVITLMDRAVANYKQSQLTTTTDTPAPYDMRDTGC